MKLLMVCALLFSMPSYGLTKKDVQAMGLDTSAPAPKKEEPALKLCPDGTYVKGEKCTLCPDGKYVGGDKCTMAPDGTYH